MAGCHVARVWRACLFLLLLPALPVPVMAREAEAYRPSAGGMASPPVFWWAVDTSPGHDPELSSAQLLDGLQAWLSGASGAAPVAYSQGLRLGLLAMVPDAEGARAARVLHAPVPLDSLQDWPAIDRYRDLLMPDADMAGADTVQANLHGLPSSGGLLRLWLELPVRSGAQPSTLRVEVRSQPAGELLAVSQLLPQRLTETRWRLDLTTLAGQAQGAQPGLPPTRWLLMPEQAGMGAATWQPWSEGVPASWHLGWREAAERATGRARLVKALEGLRAPAGAHLPGDADALWLALSGQLQSPARILPAETAGTGWTPGCGRPAGLLLTRNDQPALTSQADPLWDDRAEIWQLQALPGSLWPGPYRPWHVQMGDLTLALSAWRDRSLASEPVMDVLQPRLHDGSLLGLDAYWLRPVPGRRSWPGDHVFIPCDSPAGCDALSAGRGSLRASLAASAGVPVWFTDQGVSAGQMLADWRASTDRVATQDALLGVLGLPANDLQRAALLADLQAEFAHPLLSQGLGIFLNGGAGRPQGLLALGLSDGGLILLDGASDRPLWAWRPAATWPRWARHRLNPPVAEPELAHAGDWQGWPEAGSGQPARHLYGLQDGQLMALDLTEPERPRLLFRGVQDEVERPGVLSVFSAGTGEPRLLLSAGPGSQGMDALRLLDGRDGHLLWRAASPVAAAAGEGGEARSPVWLAGWSALPAAAGGLWLYSVDTSGVVWRLSLPLPPAEPALQPVATLPDLPAGRRFGEAPSVAWLREPGQLAQPVLALTGGASGAPAALYVLRDRVASGGGMLSGQELMPWPAGSMSPPAHAWGWWRLWERPDERPAGPPRWLRGQVLVATETPVADSCTGRRWQARSYRLPWRADATATGGMSVNDGGISSAAVATTPVLTAEGAVSWPGAPGMSQTPPRPAASRVRTGKQPVPLPR